MNADEPIVLKRDCEAVVVPVGTPVTLRAGEKAYITQSLGGSYTVIVNGNMFRIAGKDGDALGIEPKTAAPAKTAAGPSSPEEIEKQVWQEMRNCYDPEIPVNIVDLGLVYDCRLTALESGQQKAEVKMTLTAPGCGMGDYLKQDVANRLLTIEGIEDADVQLVWEPQWNQGMMTEAAKLQLGLL